jgi:outer membrane protein
MKDRNKSLVLVTAVIFLSCLAMTAPALHATDVTVGLGGGLAPEFEGSEDYEGAILPYLSGAWSNHMAIELLGSKAKFNLIPSATWKGGLVGEFIPERDDVDSNAVDKLEDVDASIMLGGFFGLSAPPGPPTT